MPIITRLTGLLILLLLPLTLIAQGPANNWYFGGGAGITFDTSPPTALFDGNLQTLEGSASISDEYGQLLFYTDGTTVYDRNGAVMENGTGLFGDQSSTQSAIIIPLPLSTTIFYIFTVDVLRLQDENLNSNGVNYSIVDFSGNPNGVVTQKNIKLLNYSAEKLSAVVKGCESDTVWMVTLSSVTSEVPVPNREFNLNTIYAFAVTPNGVSTTPVRSRLPININDPRGSLKFSPDGKKIAIANVSSGLYLMDFNAETGVASNPLRIPINHYNDAPYGVEFSPNNKFLYVHSTNNADPELPPSSHFSSLFQFNLGAPDIADSKVLLDEQSLFRGSLQLGPDGKIYRAMSRGYFEGLPYLGVIENPNAAGLASNYQDRAIDLGLGVSYQGLPPFNQSLFNLVDIIGNNISTSELFLCSDENYTLSYEERPGATYTWYKNDERLSIPNSSGLRISAPAGVSFPYTEEYRLVFDLNDGSCERKGIARVTYYSYPKAPDTPLELIQCEDAGNADGFSLFNLDELVPELTRGQEDLTVSFYVNQADANSSVNPLEPFGYRNLSPSQTLFARVASPGDCATIVPFKLLVSSTQANTAILQTCDEEYTGIMNFDLGRAEQQLLAGQAGNLDINYYSNQEAALLENPEFLLPQIYTNETPYSQIIYARLENNNFCFAISSIELRVNEKPQFEMPQDIFYCTNTFPENITIKPNLSQLESSTYTYQWMPEGQTTPEIQINQPGIYTLTITKSLTGCSTTKSFEVIAKDLALIEKINIIDASQENSASVIVSGRGTYEFSLSEEGPFQDSNEFRDLTPGFYTAFVRSKEGCGVVESKFSIVGFPPFFTPNEDGFNDLWQVQGVSETIQPGTTIRIFDRYGKLLKDLDPLSRGWDGTFNGRPLPSDDYWFLILLQDGREFKSHFTLLRQ